MASVAICPHCYLQLAIPEQAASDALIECPSCHNEFAVEKATVRKIPTGVLKENPAKTGPSGATSEPSLPEVVAEHIAAESVADVIPLSSLKAVEAGPPAEMAEHADADIAAWFRSNKTVPDVVPITAAVANMADEAPEDSDTFDSDLEDDAVTNAEDPTPMDEPRAAAAEQNVDPQIDEPVSVRPTAVTLADWQTLHSGVSAQARDLASPSRSESPESAVADSMESIDIELEGESSNEPVPGPSFDLPDVPLTLGNGATVEFSSEHFPPAASGTDFELEDVDFDAADERWPKGEFAGDANEPAHDANAVTMAEIDLLDERPDISSYDESLKHASEEPAGYYEDSSTAIGGEQVSHDLPPSLPPQPGRRKRSALRTMVGAVAGAPIGLAIGYFALLWWKGPSADFLEVAKYIPAKFLPSSFVSAAPRDENVVTTRPESVAAEPAAKDSTAESANMPASFEAPVKPLAGKPGGEDDRYATSPRSGTAAPEYVKTPKSAQEEPRRFAPPAAAPLSGDEAHIIGAPLFTVAEFAATFAQAEKAQAGLVDGDLSDPAVRKQKGLSYKQLCDLAQVVTFCDDSSTPDRLKELRQNADELFQKILSTAHARDEVAKIAAIWIDSPYRKHGGIFMAGTVRGGEIAGDSYEYQLTTEGGGELQLLLPRPIDTHVAAAGQPVGIVGSIVDEPAHKVSGYAGDSPRVIWVRDVIPLD
jgi:hypothetical protein